MLDKGDRLSLATEPYHARESMRKGEFDVILVALDEHDEDAVVVCRTVRRYCAQPIVMLVTHAGREQVVRGYRLGADAHVVLPCDPRIFRARLQAVSRRTPTLAA